jgi:hypothetical protein
MPDRCDYPYCRNPIHLRYLGRYLCYEHWVEVCKKEDEEYALRKTTSEVPVVRGDRPGPGAS